MEEANVFKSAVGLIGICDELLLFDKPLPLDFINEKEKEGYNILEEIEKQMQETLKN